MSWSSSSSSWLRVASGFRLVASTALEQLQKDKIRQEVWARHGIELARNLDIALRSDNSGIEKESIFKKPPTDTQEDSSDRAQNNASINKGTVPFERKDDTKVESDPNQNSFMIDKKNDAQYDDKWKNEIAEGDAVPSTRIQRAFGFASLGIGLAAGTARHLLANRLLPTTDETGDAKLNEMANESQKQNIVMGNEQNANLLAQSLCRMRGAALKLGQMLSIQDETFVHPQLALALEQVRKGANAMPISQLQQQLDLEIPDRHSLIQDFSNLPFAAASIGQVHTATLIQNQQRVAVKVQYPGVAESIDSDLNNLKLLVQMTGLTPPGLFIENIIRVGRTELKAECDYTIEAQHQTKFRELVMGDAFLRENNVNVPAVLPELSTSRILTTEYCAGSTIDKVVQYCDQEERNRIARAILYLTTRELFVWRFMQTDPNWGNFLYDMHTQTTHLIDFGAARSYDKEFVDGYLRIVWAASNPSSMVGSSLTYNSEEILLKQSQEMGFLTGEENDIMLDAHLQSGWIIGEPFATNEEYDFASSAITQRLAHHGSAFLQHRLTPPPEEVYTLHRKLAGAYNLCIKLQAKIKCRDLLISALQKHKFDDGKEHPLNPSL